SASPRCCTDDIELWLIEAELKSKLISRSIFGLSRVRLWSWSRSSIDSERVGRLRTLLINVISRCFFSIDCGSTERLRVAGAAFSDVMIALVEIVLSPAKARPAVIESAAPMVIALIPKSVTELVIVVILAVTRLMAFG